METEGGGPLKGPGELHPTGTGDGGRWRASLFPGPLDSDLRRGQVEVDCRGRGGPVRPGGGTMGLA